MRRRFPIDLISGNRGALCLPLTWRQILISRTVLTALEFNHGLAMSGVLDAAGKVDVTVTAAIDREVRKLDEKVLVWGNEKVLSTSTDRLGSATQPFVIEVQPDSLDTAPRRRTRPEDLLALTRNGRAG